MALFNIPPVVDALDDLLDRERQAILAGDLDMLARQAGEKARLLERLAGSTADSTRIERLRIKADRNQELLVAVARGIKSVSRRLKEMKAPKANFRTYGKAGMRPETAVKGSSVEKRA